MSRNITLSVAAIAIIVASVSTAWPVISISQPTWAVNGTHDLVMVHKAKILGVGKAWGTFFAAQDMQAVLNPNDTLTVSGHYRVRRPDAGEVFPFLLTLPVHRSGYTGMENRFYVVSWDHNYYTDTDFRARLADFLDGLDASINPPFDVNAPGVAQRVQRVYSGQMPFIPILGKVQVLDIWVNGRLVGDTVRQRGEGRIDIRYYANILDTEVPHLLNKKVMGRLTMALPPSQFWVYD